MVFKLASDGELVLCSSARCVRRLLGKGWRLADPSQTDALLQALKDEDDERSAANLILEGPSSGRDLS